MNTSLKISVIIPTHNRADLLKGTIQSLKTQKLPNTDYEIIVVDNASTDNTSEVVRECNLEGGKEVFCLREEQLGLHFARHAGARAARGTILAYVDDVAVYAANWLEQIFDCYNDSKVGCAGGKVLPKWRKQPPEWVRSFHSALSVYDWGEERRELKWPESIYGVNFSIRRDLLFQFGGFNPDSFGNIWLGNGEIGLVKKVVGAGFKIIYNPEAVAWHIVPEERLTLNYFQRRFRNQGVNNAYAEYRESRPGTFGLIIRSTHRAFKGLAHAGLASIYRIMGNKHFYRHRFRAYSQFSQARYYFRLLHDTNLRSLVEKEDWINQ